MHAREFVKPTPLELPTPSGKAMYPFSAYLGEFVWSYGKWGEDGWDDAQIRLGEIIDATPDGELVKIDELDDWEKLREANKAAEIKGPYAHKLRKHQKAIKSSRKPEAT